MIGKQLCWLTVICRIMAGKTASVQADSAEKMSTRVGSFAAARVGSFSDLIENGPKYLPNDWTISPVAAVTAPSPSCFLAHVDGSFPAASPPSLPSIPHCDRAVYLWIEGQKHEIGPIMLHCEEAYMKNGIVKRRSFETTVEFWGDLLTILYGGADHYLNAEHYLNAF